MLPRCYEAGGAACLSVLTDKPSFEGELESMTLARSATTLRILRKDLMFDTYPVIEARAHGADCILLIMSPLDDEVATGLEAAALELGLDLLIKAHDRAELDRALRLKSPMIGINHRDLRTFKTTPKISEELAPYVPNNRLIVGESGIADPDDIVRLSRIGISSVLMGESLIAKPT